MKQMFITKRKKQSKFPKQKTIIYFKRLTPLEFLSSFTHSSFLFFSFLFFFKWLSRCFKPNTGRERSHEFLENFIIINDRDRLGTLCGTGPAQKQLKQEINEETNHINNQNKENNKPKQLTHLFTPLWRSS